MCFPVEGNIKDWCCSGKFPLEFFEIKNLWVMVGCLKNMNSAVVTFLLLLDAFDRLRSAWWWSKFRFMSGFWSHSLGLGVRHSLKMKMNVLAGLMENVFTLM